MSNNIHSFLKYQAIKAKSLSDLHYKEKQFVESYQFIKQYKRLSARLSFHERERILNHVEGGESLLYLYSNNTDEKLNLLQPYQKRAVHVLYSNCDKFIKEVGISNVGFLTLTFPDNISDHKTAYKRFDNMRKRFLSQNFGKWMWVKERQKRGAWHFHLLIDCRVDIRNGFDFDEYSHYMDKRNKSYKKGDKENGKKYSRKALRSASAVLRDLWELLRVNLYKYGFGRSELLPIKSNTEGMARYVGKYIVNHTGNRKPIDKGVRLTGYCSDFIRSNAKFAWNTENAKLWRNNVKLFFTHIMGYPESLHDMAGKIISDRFGKNWAYILQDDIMNIEETIKKRLKPLTDSP